MTARLYVANDGASDLCVWTTDDTHPTYPRPVLAFRDVKDAGLRAAIVALVEGGGVA